MIEQLHYSRKEIQQIGKNKRCNSNAENNLAAIDWKQKRNYRSPYIQVWYRNRKANWNVFSIIDIRVSIRVNSICQLATSSWYRNQIYTCVTDSPSSVIFHRRPSIRSQDSSSTVCNIHREISIEKRRNAEFLIQLEPDFKTALFLLAINWYIYILLENR